MTGLERGVEAQAPDATRRTEEEHTHRQNGQKIGTITTATAKNTAITARPSRQ
jgi:hypothetical protein